MSPSSRSKLAAPETVMEKEAKHFSSPDDFTEATIEYRDWFSSVLIILFRRLCWPSKSLFLQT
jgi:hypothetical protein